MELDEPRGTVSLLSVTNDVEDGVVETSRLSDSRMVNLVFVEPPWTALGSPGPLANLDISVETQLG